MLYVKKTGVEQILIKSEQNIISEVKGELLSIERLDTPEEIKEELTRVAMSENPGYNKEDIENIRLVYHLVKERGMTLQGARQRLKENKEIIVNQTEIIDRLTSIKEELLKMRKALDYIT